MSVSLLDRGRHTVTVEVAETGARRPGSLSRSVTYAAPVTVSRVSVQPVTTSETETTAPGTCRIIGRGSWPGGPLSRVTVINGPNAGQYDQEAAAMHHDSSPATAHWVVTITRRGSEAR